MAKTIIPPAKPLTAKQEEFARQFVIDNNGTQAAIRSGYSQRAARVIAAENLTKPNVIKFIEILKENLRKEAGLDATLVVQELRDLAEFNIQDFVTKGNRIKEISSLTRRQAKAITAIKTKETVMPDGSVEIITELKFCDRRATWVDLGRHVGIFEKDNKQKIPLSSELTDTQFQQLLAEARECATIAKR